MEARIPDIESLTVNGKTYRFSSPQRVTVKVDDEYTFVTMADMDGCGQTLDDAIEDLADTVEVMWEEYALCDDDKLDAVARRLKRRLLKLITVEDSAN